MAAAALTPAELQALILQLQSQVATLTSGATPAGPAPAAIVFADTPQSLYANDLLDFSTKRESSIYEQGCKTLDDTALTDGFKMTPNLTVVFVESLTRSATAMGWNAGSKQITTFRQKEDKAWTKFLPKDGDKKSKEMGSTRSTGVNITWWCACISPPSVAWAISARRSSRQPLEATPPPMPLLPSLSPTLNSKPSLPA